MTFRSSGARSSARCLIGGWPMPLLGLDCYVMRVLENELAYKTRRGEQLAPQELNQILRPAP